MERTTEEIQYEIEENQDILNHYMYEMQNAPTCQERSEASRQVQMYQSALLNLQDELSRILK